MMHNCHSEKVAKSSRTNNPIVHYCTNLSVREDPLECELRQKTTENCKQHTMLGAPEVLQLGKMMIRLIKAKRALDIGTFTGASALAWATALPTDGEVLSIDRSHENLDDIGKPIVEKNPEIAKKIIFKLGSALEILDALLADGQAEKWDFAFIDADKESYPDYYERCVQLLRSGGVILIDNALWNGRVVEDVKDHASESIHRANQLAAKDCRVDNILLNLGDGTHLIIKQ